MSDSEEESCKSNDSQMGFVTMLKDFPVLFSKSQTPSVRKVKSQALELVKKQWEVNYGSEVTINQLLKKINNMKARLKKKTDINRTGNRKIVLHDWEKVLLEIMEGDINPAIVQVPGAISAGHEQQNSTHPASIVENPTSSTLSVGSHNSGPPKKKKKMNLLEEYETDSTKQLSNSELQRLVLLKQLKVLTMKEEKLKRELGDEVSEYCNTEYSRNSDSTVNQSEQSTFVNL